MAVIRSALVLAFICVAACSSPSPPGGVPDAEARRSGADPADREGGPGVAHHPTSKHGGIKLMATPARVAELCRRAPSLAEACPKLVPKLSRNTPTRAEGIPSPGDYDAVSVEWGVPYGEGIVERNAPPAFVHLTVQAGTTGEAFPFEWPAWKSRPDLGKRLRRGAALLGRREWDRRSGRLVLAPSYPFGGVNGDHLIFRWTATGADHAVSLHAWAPLAEAEATLRAVVGSIPRE